jgi:hypothetical protein
VGAANKVGLGGFSALQPKNVALQQKTLAKPFRAANN